jgi:hypothetical protein
VSDARKTAVILHGPPCAFKSRIIEVIKARHPGRVKVVNLDEGWAPTETRYTGGTDRYDDIRDAPEPVLVIELAHGEPDDGSPGPTRGANEWVSELQRAGRTVHPFQLRIDGQDGLRRLLERWGNALDCHGLYWFWRQFRDQVRYEDRHPTVTFPEIADFRETIIETTGREIAAIADEIMTGADLLDPAH